MSGKIRREACSNIFHSRINVRPMLTERSSGGIGLTKYGGEGEVISPTKALT